MDFAVMKAYLPRFVNALLITLRIGWQGVALALMLGVACAVVVHWKVPVLRKIVGGYIELFRNTPLLVQLFFIYFALPKIGIRISAEACGTLGRACWAGPTWRRPSAADWKTLLPFRQRAPRALA